MEQRILGCNERGDQLKVGAIGLGCMGLSQSYPPFPPKEEGIKFLRDAVELGVDFFDTSEVYAIYKNEELVGEALEPVRDRVKLATKGGWDIQNGKCVGLDSRPETLRRALEGSLKRLRTDHIDLYYIHRVDTKVPIEEVAGAMKQFFDEGKILHWGISEPGAETLRKANAVFHVTAVQNEYSLWFRDIEENLLPVLEELKIGLVPFSPLGKGVLTGGVSKDQKFDAKDIRHTIPRFNDEKLLAKNVEQLEKLKAFASVNDTTPARLALAWLLRQRDWIVPIPGTKKLHRLQENIGAADVSLSESDWAQLQSIADEIEIIGNRYDDKNMALVGR